jgi:hypothetical protein
MPVLTSQQRKLLDDACVKGRRTSEQAVRAALGSLAVTAERPPAHLGEQDRQLRRGLRAKSRQLGDQGDKLDLLIAECAYEQWHRLLFARFLAENNLLIHPEYRAPVTLEDCEELADSLGEPDGWAVAGRFATEVLPGIFRLDDPCVQLRLAPEGRLALEGIVGALPAEIFGADDALGWVYQYWQRERKDAVNDSERKVGGADLGPVTQLFTENYMVRFLLENSLGAWWSARHPESPLIEQWSYLRCEDGLQPAAGVFDTWPSRVAEVTVMDPCCGSGHFLVEAFDMLWRMRVEEEGLSVLDAQDAVLRENLFGLELDPRCVQIAMFAIALRAWRVGGGWRELPIPHVACSGVPVGAAPEDWAALAGDDENLRNALVRLHILFRRADTLGSLIDPKRSVELSDGTGLQVSLDDVDWTDVSPLLEKALAGEAADPASSVLSADAAGLSRAAGLLSESYTLVCTNPPYLGRSKQAQVLMDFADARYSDARSDLGLVFLRRALELCSPGGTVALVEPQTWLQLKRSEGRRKSLLQRISLNACVWMGSRAFEAIVGEVVTACLLIATVRLPQPLTQFLAIDVQDAKGPSAKAKAVRSSDATLLEQQQQLMNPESRILPRPILDSRIGDFAESHQGIKTSDNPRFVRFFWEMPALAPGWRFMQSAPEVTDLYTGRSEVVFWEDGYGAMTEVCQDGAPFRGRAAWGKRGVVIREMGSLPATLYTGELFDGTGSVVIPRNESDLGALWAFCTSGELYAAVRSIDTSLKVSSGTLTSVPLDVAHWRAVAEANPAIEDPSSLDATQWLFDGRPDCALQPIQVAVCRLLGYRWPSQPDVDDLDQLADADGIVCLPSVRGERTAADRLQELLARSYGGTWTPARTQELLARAGSNKKNLDAWLRDDFFSSHCQVFKQRPFIWQVWDGRKDGFSALVNYHRLDRPALEKLAYSYLGDWIERQVAGVRDDVAGAEERLAAARALQQKLELILGGEPPYDIYVRWKSLAAQPIGWEPDLNDGVRLNIRPCIEAGVLRSKVNVKWDKDRGKNPDGKERLNNLHHTNAQKQAARGGSV